MTTLKSRHLISLFMAWLFLTGSLNANAESGMENVAIQGYSPVSYFTRNTAERGSPAFSVVYEGKQYHFTSAEQVELFKRDPERYIPLFADFCPYSLTLGRQVGIDPTNFKIIGGKLLLFHKSSEMDGLKAWNDHGNEGELLKRANQEFMRVSF